MPRSAFGLVVAGALAIAVAPVGAQVRRLAELNTVQIRALEQHGPHPEFVVQGVKALPTQ